MDTGSSYGKTDVQQNSSYATLASYKTGSSMTREQWTYEGYQTGYTSDIRRTVVDNLRFLTVYYEVDTRNTWYYNYTKTLTDLYPDGTIIPSTERTVADEQVQYIEDGISQWTEYKSASQLAEENMLYLSQHYKIPDFATFTSMSTWAVGSYEAIFYDEPLTRSDYMELFKNEEQSLSGIRHQKTYTDPSGMMYYEFSDGTVLRQNDFYKGLPENSFDSEIPISAKTPSWTMEYYGGIGDGVQSTMEGIEYVVKHPLDTASHLGRLLNPVDMAYKGEVITSMFQDAKSYVGESSGARVTGRATFEIAGILIGAKGVTSVLDSASPPRISPNGTGNFANKKFASRDLLESHYEKHAVKNNEFHGAYSNADEYMQGARDAMSSGTKVGYQYKGETRTGYMKFMGNSRKGEAKFEFVGTNANGDVTTYHVKRGEDLWKLLNNNKRDKTINPLE